MTSQESISQRIAATSERLARAFASSRLESPDKAVSGKDYMDEEIVRALRSKAMIIDDEFVRYFYNDLPAFTGVGLLHVLPRYVDYALRFPRGHEAQHLVYKMHWALIRNDPPMHFNKEQRDSIIEAFSLLS